MTIIATLFAAAALAAGAPAASAPAVAAPDAPLPHAKASPSRYAVRYNQKSDKYCVRDRRAVATTGTRLVPEECKTSSDWAAAGLTIGRKD